MDMSDRLLVILDVGIMVSIKSIIFSMKFTIVVLFWTEFGPFLTQDFEQSCLANADPVRFKSQKAIRFDHFWTSCLAHFGVRFRRSCSSSTQSRRQHAPRR